MLSDFLVLLFDFKLNKTLLAITRTTFAPCILSTFDELTIVFVASVA